MEEKNKIEIEDSQNADGSSGENAVRNEDSKKRKRSRAIGTFVLSLLASIVLWIVAVDYEVTDYEKTFTNINVQVKGKTELLGEKGMQVETDDSFRLDVTVSGKRSQLSLLDSSSFTAYIDVSSIEKEGSSQLKLEIEPINGIEIVSQSSSYLWVKAEKRITQTFNLNALMGTVQLENGVEYELRSSVKEVSVTGSESLLRNVENVVAYVNPEPKNVTESFSSRCKIIIESEGEIDSSLLTVTPEYCDIDVVLTKEKSVPVHFNVEGVEDIDYGASFSFQDDKKERKLLVSGEPKIIDSLDEILVNIPYEKIVNRIESLDSGKENFTIEGIVEYPEGVESVDGILVLEVNVNVEKREIAVSGNKVSIDGVPEDFFAQANDVVISVWGLSEELDNITLLDDITISVDVSEKKLEEGSINVSGTVYIQSSACIMYKKECEVTLSIAFRSPASVLNRGAF